MGTILRTHKAGKGPGGCGAWGLGSRNRRGPGVPFPWSQRAGDLTCEPSRLPGLSGRGKRPPLLSSSALPLGGPLPPASPDLPSLPLMPRKTNVAKAGGEGAWRAGIRPGSSAGSLRRSPALQSYLQAAWVPFDMDKSNPNTVN